MVSLPLAVAMALANVVSLAIVFLLLYRGNRQPHLLFWGLSWVAQALRYGADLLVTLSPVPPLCPILVQWFSLAAGALLIWGTAVFVARDAPPHANHVWTGLGAAAMWPVIATTAGLAELWVSLPTFILLATAFIWTGQTVLRRHDLGSPTRQIIGIGMIAWGLHKVDYPLIRAVPEFASWGYLISVLLGLVVSAGLLTAYLKRTKRDLGVAESR